MSEAYRKFLESKVRFNHACGVAIDLDDTHQILKPHQKAIVQWAVRGGRRAIFARFGLGKSLVQLECIRQLFRVADVSRGLIVCPLGVRQEFKRDAEMIDLTPRFVRTDAEVDGPGVYLTNYESIREGKLSPRLFDVASLDEAAVLRSFGSKTYQEFMPLFADVQYRFVATATPDPNRYKELIHYAAFLGIMDSGQALTRWFQRDSSQANNLTLYPHKEAEFWLWVHSWAVFLQKPSDLGFSDEGYDLPPLDIHYHEVSVCHDGAGVDRDGQALMFRNAALGLKEAAREKRDTIDLRVEKLTQIVNESPDDHFLLWHDLERERHAIKAALPEAVEVFGSLDLDTREQRVIDFSDGLIRLLATKPELSGSGCNFQRHCHRAIFTGIGYQFHDFIQAIHRIYRFLQIQPCRIDVIYAETEREILADLQTKWARHDEQVEKMSQIIREHGLNMLSMEKALTRTIGIERREERGEKWLTANNDCVVECETMEANSVDLIVTSVPFANHYEYVPSYNDFGHTENNSHFWEQMDFLTPQLLRILKPGRIYACHVKDRINFGNVTGAGIPTVSPFHAEALFHGKGHGFDYLGMITVVTDVVRENNQTYRLGWSEQCKDGTKMGVGSPEYILLFHKPQTDRTRGYADEPVTKEKPRCIDADGVEGLFDSRARPIPGTGYSRSRWQVDAHAMWRSSGNRLLTAEEMAGYRPEVLSKVFTAESLRHIYDHERHVAIGEQLDAKGALPATFMSLAPGSHDPNVWHDVNRMRTLNGEQTRRGLENHVCPLQFDIVDRIIRRYTNPGELVFDPFLGIGTVAVRAIRLGRKGRGVELNHSYFRDAVRYCQLEEKTSTMPSLFDALGEPYVDAQSIHPDARRDAQHESVPAGSARHRSENHDHDDVQVSPSGADHA